MTTLPPPPRYRVVEQGRRLVVIDTLTGQPATRSTPAAGPAGTLPAGPKRINFDGRALLVTHPFYDDKAPRTLTLDPGATQLIENGRSVLIGVAIAYAVVAVFAPWVLVLLLVALNPRARAAAREAATRWLDRYDAGTSTG